MLTKFILTLNLITWLKKRDLIFIFRIVKIVLFCALITTLLFSRSVFAKFLYFFMLFFVFVNLLPLGKKITTLSKELKISIICAGCFSLLFYILFFSKINSLELWGDEIGVILFAEKHFEEISGFVLTQHAATPPLDYWNMHYLKQVVDLFPVDYQEFFFRVPYMIFHTISAVIFLLIVNEIACIKKENLMTKKLRFSLMSVSFLTYFFHPILFSYAFELRFYEFAALGTSITILLFLRGKLFHLQFLPLLLLFVLNSIFQLLTVVPFLVLGFFDKQVPKKNFFVVFFANLFLGTILFFHVNKYQPVAEPMARMIVEQTLKDLLSIEFLHWWMCPLTVILLFFAYKNKTRTSINLFFVLSSQFISITAISYVQGYFDLHVRHYLYLIPTVLTILFLAINQQKKKMSYFVLITLFLFFFIPWLDLSLKLLDHSFDMSKHAIGAKKMMQEAKDKKQILLYNSQISPEAIQLATSANQRIDKGVYDFYNNYFNWYAKRYHLTIEDIADNKGACEFFNSHKAVIKVNVYDFSQCDEKSVTHTISDSVMIFIESKYKQSEEAR